MANLTKLASITSDAPVAITATQIGRLAVIQEDEAVANWPTTDFLIFKFVNGSPTAISRRVLAGTSYEFEKDGQNSWFPGDTIGYIQTVTGTTDFILDEAGS